MHPFLLELGVPAELQAFFNITRPDFSFGNDTERFAPGAHFVPTTRNVWLAGNDMASEVIITSGAMDAVAYLTLNAYRYPFLPALSFMALGNLPHAAQLAWIRANRQKRKTTLAFGRDLAGRLTDIAVAAGISGNSVRLQWLRGQVRVTVNEKAFDADPELISLNSFEKAAGIRTGIRTRKPNRHNTFLDQLKYDNN